MTKRYFTTTEAAAYTGWNPKTGGGFSPASFRSWRLRGGGPPYEQPSGPGGKTLYPVTAFKRWLRKRRPVTNRKNRQ